MRFSLTVGTETFDRDVADDAAALMLAAFESSYGDRWWPTEVVPTVSGDDSHEEDAEGNVISTKIQRVAMTPAEFWALCVRKWGEDVALGYAKRLDQTNQPNTDAVKAMIDTVEAT